MRGYWWRPSQNRPPETEKETDVTTPIFIDHSQVGAYIDTLARFGAFGETGVRRLVYSPEWVAAMDQCRRWAEQADLDVSTDAVGNLWARIPGNDPGRSVVTGSHIDSQRSGGRYDGALGAICGILALGALKAQAGTPIRTLEALVLCEEEGSRFPTAGFWGSRAIIGKVSADDPAQVLSYEGETIADAMRSVGLDPSGIPSARRDDIEAFIELHIEQGPVLEDAGLSVAIVDAITGIAQFEVTLTGEQNHAGAFPMDLRRDPMAGFAEIAGCVIDHAHRLGRPAVTTVGRCDVDPGASAIIPRSVRFSIDARHPDPEARIRLYAVHDALIREVAQRRGLDVKIRKMIDLEPCKSDPGVLEALRSGAERQGIATLTMPSGAGHDTQQMSLICKTAMVFVRSAGGRSHTPEELSSVSDCANGIRVVAEALRQLAY